MQWLVTVQHLTEPFLEFSVLDGIQVNMQDLLVSASHQLFDSVDEKRLVVRLVTKRDGQFS